MSKHAPPSLQRKLLLPLGLAAVGLFAVVSVRRGRGPEQPRPPLSRATVSAPPSAVTSGPELAPSASAVPSALPPPFIDEMPDNIPAQRELLLRNMQSQLGLAGEALEKTRAIFEGSRWLGQGNPKVTRHPMTRAECRAIRSSHEFRAPDARCGAPNMVPVFDPRAGESASSAKLCVDQYEYPNIACDYPVTWVKSDEAENLCRAQGKRLCDAHEWEGACAGALHTPEEDYTFGQRRMMQEYLHNKSREIVWAYGKQKNHKLCGTGASKSRRCFAPSWEECGSNTYPAGSFPECVSSFGVYDQHGNAAEHMNLPLVAEELGVRGGTGENEMKGSWFIFQQLDAHEDDCRWRALSWHAGRLMAPDAHRNYHLSFRCCKDL